MDYYHCGQSFLTFSVLGQPTTLLGLNTNVNTLKYQNLIQAKAESVVANQ